ncbi:MAG TPA: hypothetical protein PLL10_08520, partial [Elusimicrobiales bacterium]|nr:hypothetical protein [Elusimicrobiales bacterium]
MNGKTLKSRYLSLKQDGSEMYVEDVPVTGKTEDYIPLALEKLAAVRKALPKAKWSITIEEQFVNGLKPSDMRYFTICNAET